MVWVSRWIGFGRIFLNVLMVELGSAGLVKAIIFSQYRLPRSELSVINLLSDRRSDANTVLNLSKKYF